MTTKRRFADTAPVKFFLGFLIGSTVWACVSWLTPDAQAQQPRKVRMVTIRGFDDPTLICNIWTGPPGHRRGQGGLVTTKSDNFCTENAALVTQIKVAVEAYVAANPTEFD